MINPFPLRTLILQIAYAASPERAMASAQLSAALNYGAQLAETLSIAHGKGISHREQLLSLISVGEAGT
jgi:hypothetical protein